MNEIWKLILGGLKKSNNNVFICTDREEDIEFERLVSKANYGAIFN